MILASLAVGAYVAIGLVAAILVARRRLQRVARGETSRPVSVIVAARDEALHLPECLAALAAQRHDAPIEFIIVDDESTDETPDIIRRYASSDGRFRYVSASGGSADLPPGKARAIHAGVQAASHDIILVTDADCRPPERWCAAMSQAFDDERVGVLGGIAEVRPRRFDGALQWLDWTLLLAVASGLSLLGRPLTAMGNNMAFRRRAYDDVGGYPALPPSVTEDYALFRAIGSHTDWRARLDPHPSLSTWTEPVAGPVAMFGQRRRWARGALSASPLAFAFYAIVLAAHALPLFILPTAGSAAVWMIGTKIGTDAIVIASMMRRPSDAFRAAVMLVPHQVWLYAYALTLPLTLAVQPDVRWKGRIYRAQVASESGE